MKPITHLFVAGLLLLALSAAGQPVVTTFSPSTVTVASGAPVDLQLKVQNFTNITSIQFSIAYDNTTMQFVSMDNFTLPGFGPSNYNSQPTQGKVTVTWFPDFGANPNGVTVADNTSLFTMHFNTIATGCSTVNLSTTPLAIEITRNFSNVTVTYQNGGSSITVGSCGPPPPPVAGFKIISNTIYIPKDSTRCMPVTVNDFDGIISMQYAMHWDKNVLTYVKTQAHNLPFMSNSTTNFLPNQTTGTCLVSWYDDNAVGVTRADGTKIYEVCFKAIGNAGTYSLITTDGVGFPPGNGSAEAYNNANPPVNVWSTTPGNLSGVTDTIFVTAPPPPVNNVVFTADKDTVNVGGQTCVAITATSNFDDIISAQFAVTYNATQIQYQSIQLGANPLGLSGPGPGGTSLNFNTTTAGQVTFSWDSQTSQGVTLPPNTVLFSVCFTAAAPANTLVPVTIGPGAGYPVEVVKDPNIVLNPTLTSGHIFIQQGAVPSIQWTNVLQPACNGGSTGTLGVNVLNGTANSYSWTGPNGTTFNQQSLTGLKSGVYSVTITLQGGNTLTGNYDLPQPPAITLPSNSTTPVNCNGGSDGAIAITASGGTGTLTFSWTGPNNFVSTNEDLTGLKAGNYIVVVKDANNCSLTSSPISITQPNPITVPTASLVVTDVTCFGGTNGSINITPQGGTAPYTFAWGGPNGPAGVNEDLLNVGPGLYTVSITDSKSCPTFVSQSIQVQGPTAALAATTSNVQNVRCFGELNGAVTLNVTGGWAPVSTYVWKDQNGVQVSTAPSPTNLGPGAYNVTVTDAKGCTTNLASPVFISGPASPMNANPQTTNAACAGAGGTISLNVAGGYGGYQMNWSPSVPDTNNVPAGTYSVTITDTGGCSDVETVTVGGPQAISSGNPTISHVTCASAGNGCITLALSGGTQPYTVNWSNNQSGQSICGLSGGNYTPTITDGAGCTLVLAAITVNEPSALAIAEVVTPQNGAVFNGAIDLNFNNGGQGPYSFNWTGPNGFTNLSTTDVLTGLEAGDYHLTITDNTGCQLVQTIIVGNVNPLGSASITSITPSCGDDGCANLSIPNNAQGPFVIIVNNGTPQTFDTYTPAVCGLAGGVVSLSITDATSNSVSLQGVVPSLPQAIVSSSSNNPNQDFSNGFIDQSPFPAGTILTFQWSDGPTSEDRINLDSGLYVVTITNTNSGCTAVYEYHLTRVYQPISLSATDSDPSCSYSTNGAINVSISGGAEPYTYSWTGPNNYTATTEDISNLAAGTYFLTVTDALGTTKVLSPTTITAQSNLIVSNVNELSVFPGGYQVSGPGECDGEASVAASGGVGSISVQWSNGASGISTSTLCGGPYSVTVSDGLGCTAVWTDDLSSPSAIVATSVALSNYNGFNVKCNGSCDGAGRVTVSSGGVGPYIFQWPASVPFNLINTGAEYSQASGLCGGDYNVTITDVNGNTIVQAVTLTEPDPITVEFTSIEPSESGLCNGQIIAEPVGGANPFEYEWLGSKGHEGTGSIADGLCAGEVVVFNLVDASGCEASAQDTVEYPLSTCFGISAVITPNNDGDNDYLKILCIEQSADNNIEVYNRWGQLVFKTKGYVNGDVARCWYGTANGEPLAEGVYFYVFNYVDPVSGDAVQVKGYVNLLR